MHAVRVLRFSGPAEGRDALVALAQRAGIDVVEQPPRSRAEECWVELAIPVARSAAVDDEQVARSMEHAVDRLGAGFRLREYLTEVRRAGAPGTGTGPTATS